MEVARYSMIKKLVVEGNQQNTKTNTIAMDN